MSKFFRRPVLILLIGLLSAARVLTNRIDRAVIIGLRELEIRARLPIKNPVVIKDADREILVEMLRTRPDPDNPNNLGVSWNTHDQGDLCNLIDWSREQTYSNVIDYYKGLIDLRKRHEAFRMETAGEIQKGLTFINENIDFLIAYKLEEQDGDDPWDQIIVIHNANRTAQTLNIPEVNRHWKVVVDGERAGVTPLERTEVRLGQGFITVPPVSAIVIYTKKGVFHEK